ncbi:MAG: hypothetical protein WAK88_13595 [Candidatus Cybelea sp.]
MKRDTLVGGGETLVVMAMDFSGTGSHDINFVKPPVNARQVFDLKCALGIKAYLAEEHIGWLRERRIHAIIPIKKKWYFRTKVHYYEACEQPRPALRLSGRVARTLSISAEGR